MIIRDQPTSCRRKVRNPGQTPGDRTEREREMTNSERACAGAGWCDVSRAPGNTIVRGAVRDTSYQGQTSPTGLPGETEIILRLNTFYWVLRKGKTFIGYGGTWRTEIFPNSQNPRQLRAEATTVSSFPIGKDKHSGNIFRECCGLRTLKLTTNILL